MRGGGVKGRLKLFRKFIRFGGGRLPLPSAGCLQIEVVVLWFSRGENIKLDVGVAAAIHVPKYSILARQRHITRFRAREGDIVPSRNYPFTSSMNWLRVICE